MSFNRTQSRAVIGLITGHNTLGRHLHIHGLTDSPLCRQCGMEEETFVNVRFWPLSDTCIWAPFFWRRRISRVQVWGPSGTLARPRGSLEIDLGHKEPIKVRPRCIGNPEAPYPRAIYLS